MSSREIIIVDYEIGNVFSVCHALRHAGGEPLLTGDHDRIANAERLVLPGVGAFGKAMCEIRRRGLIEPIRAFCATGRPFLGICVGMQVLMECSSEMGEHAGFGLVPGSVERIPNAVGGSRLRVPHIGWSALMPPADVSVERWKRTVCEGFIAQPSTFYFVHSYEAHPSDPRDLLAQVDYGGYPVTAAIQCNNITGVQFHPERSGAAGLMLLEQFLSL